MRFWISTSLILLLSLNGKGQKFKSLEAALLNPEEVIHLELRKDKLTKVPESIKQFKNLEILDLGKNKLDSIPSFILELKNLKELNISKNNFSRIPRILGQMDSLKILKMANNPVLQIPFYISEFPTLQILDLWSTQLEMIHPSILKNKSIIKLDIRVTFLRTKDVEWLELARPDMEVLSSYGCDCDN